MTIHDQPTHTFEDRLLTELRAVVAERPQPAAAPAAAPARARRRLVRPAAALGTTATAVAIAALATSGSPAYAVDRNADGTVTVEIKDLKDAKGLERDLAKLGVSAVVDYLPPNTVCKPDRLDGGTSNQILRQAHPITQSFRPDGTGSLTLTPSDFADKTLVLTTAPGSNAGQLLSTIGVASAPVKPCEPILAKDIPALPPLPATKDGKLHTHTEGGPGGPDEAGASLAGGNESAGR